MEFDFDVNKILKMFSAGQVGDGIWVMKGSIMRGKNCDTRYSREITQLTKAIDSMGDASAKA